MCGTGIRRRLVRCGQKVCRTSRPADTEQCNTNPCPVRNSNPQNPKCVQDGSFFCHGNTNYCHVKGYRELCCKTCENWKPENAKAVVEDHSRLNINGFQEDDDFDEEDEEISEMDYEDIDVDELLNMDGKNPILSQLDDDMYKVAAQSNQDMDAFDKELIGVANKHYQQLSQRSYSEFV